MCYSQQRIKQYLVRDPNCDGPAPFAEEVEEGVVSTLFAVSRDKLETARKSVESGSVTGMLRERIQRAETKLRRLYGLYGDSGDGCLLDAIHDAKEEIGRLNRLLEEERAKGASTRSAMSAYEKLESVQDAWPYMSVQERRVILASVVESVTISADYTDVKLKFHLSA